MDTEEFHFPGFRGTWTSAAVWQLFWDGGLSVKEMLLLGTIDAFSKTEIGCVASNAYLAKMLRLKNPNAVSPMIAHLKELGLVEQISFNGRQRELTVKQPENRRVIKKQKADLPKSIRLRY